MYLFKIYFSMKKIQVNNSLIVLLVDFNNVILLMLMITDMYKILYYLNIKFKIIVTKIKIIESNCI